MLVEVARLTEPKRWTHKWGEPRPHGGATPTRAPAQAYARDSTHDLLPWNQKWNLKTFPRSEIPDGQIRVRHRYDGTEYRCKISDKKAGILVNRGIFAVMILRGIFGRVMPPFRIAVHEPYHLNLGQLRSWRGGIGIWLFFTQTPGYQTKFLSKLWSGSENLWIGRPSPMSIPLTTWWRIQGSAIGDPGFSVLGTGICIFSKQIPIPAFRKSQSSIPNPGIQSNPSEILRFMRLSADPWTNFGPNDCPSIGRL